MIKKIVGLGLMVLPLCVANVFSQVVVDVYVKNETLKTFYFRINDTSSLYLPISPNQYFYVLSDVPHNDVVPFLAQQLPQWVKKAKRRSTNEPIISCMQTELTRVTPQFHRDWKVTFQIQLMGFDNQDQCPVMDIKVSAST